MATRRTRKTDLLAMLGLAQRAGVLVRGTGAVRDAVRSGKARFVLFARDASPAQIEKVKGLLRHGSLPWGVFGTQDELGHAVGAAPLSAIAVTRKAFAERLQAGVAAVSGPGSGPGSDEEG